jgi:hypothetical protein
MFPNMQDKLLRAVGDELAELAVREWDERAIRTCLVLFRQMQDDVTDTRKKLETKLAEGVEARSFYRAFSACQHPGEEVLARVRGLIDRLSPSEDAGSTELADAARSLEREWQAFHGLLTEALSRCSEPVRPVDEQRWRASEEAYTRGEAKRFSRG